MNKKVFTTKHTKITKRLPFLVSFVILVVKIF